MGVQNGFANVIVWNGGVLFTVLSVFIVILFSKVLLKKKKKGELVRNRLTVFCLVKGLVLLLMESLGQDLLSCFCK